MIVPPVIKKCVVFLCPPRDTPAATGFLVGYPRTPQDKVNVVTYLVTAAHCIPEDGCPVTMRVNLRKGGALDLDAPARWWRHPDASVDVAVTPLAGPSAMDIAVVPTEMFVNEADFIRTDYAEDGVIGEGDEAFITGLFAGTHGERRNLPVVRMGNIARLTDYEERIHTEWEHGPVIVHLIEARSRGGLSGSPVFTRRTVQWETQNKQNLSHGPLRLIGYGPDVRFLGLVHGHADDADGPEAEINRGVAFVVPAKHVLETLDLPELSAMREAHWAKRRVRARPDDTP
jgi:hypothetical protein